MRVIMSHLRVNRATQKKRRYTPTKITRGTTYAPQIPILSLILCKNIGQSGRHFYLENNWHASCNYSFMTYFLNNTLDELFRDPFQINSRYWDESKEIINAEQETSIKIDAPGFEKENLKLDIKDSILRLHGKQEEDSFCRQIDKSYSIGKSMDQKSIKASYKNGVVEISIARKKDQNKTKEIKIT